jgi:hypothetical protein
MTIKINIIFILKILLYNKIKIGDCSGENLFKI